VKRMLVALTYIGLSALPVLAHSGHHERIMGTVSTIQDTRLEIKVTTGKTSNVFLTEKTKLLRGKETVKRADIRTGDRVVISAMSMKGSDGKPMLMAEEVRLGSAPLEKLKTKKHD
jgi:hypothetical protein